MKQHVKLEIEIDDTNNKKCDVECRWNDGGEYCQLYAEDLAEENKRLESCINDQISDT